MKLLYKLSTNEQKDALKYLISSAPEIQLSFLEHFIYPNVPECIKNNVNFDSIIDTVIDEYIDEEFENGNPLSTHIEWFIKNYLIYDDKSPYALYFKMPDLCTNTSGRTMDTNNTSKTTTNEEITKKLENLECTLKHLSIKINELDRL